MAVTMEKGSLLLKDSTKSPNKATKTTIEHAVVLIAQHPLTVNTVITPKTLESGRSIRRVDWDKCCRTAAATVAYCVAGCFAILGVSAGCSILYGIVLYGQEKHLWA